MQPPRNIICPACRGYIQVGDPLPRQLRCPHCHTTLNSEPNAVRALGCLPAAIASVVLFVGTTITGGGGILGVLLGFALMSGIAGLITLVILSGRKK